MKITKLFPLIYLNAPNDMDKNYQYRIVKDILKIKKRSGHFRLTPFRNNVEDILKYKNRLVFILRHEYNHNYYVDDFLDEILDYAHTHTYNNNKTKVNNDQKEEEEEEKEEMNSNWKKRFSHGLKERNTRQQQGVYYDAFFFFIASFAFFSQFLLLGGFLFYTGRLSDSNKLTMDHIDQNNYNNHTN